MTLDKSKGYGLPAQTKTLQDKARTRLNCDEFPHQAPQRERITAATHTAASGARRKRHSPWMERLAPDVNLGVPQLMMILEPNVVWDHSRGFCKVVGKELEATVSSGEFFEGWHRAGRPANGVYEGSYWDLIGDCEDMMALLRKMAQAPALLEEPPLELPAGPDLPRWEDFKPSLHAIPASATMPVLRLPPFRAPALETDLPFQEPEYLALPEVPTSATEEASPIYFPPECAVMAPFVEPAMVELVPPVLSNAPVAPEFGAPEFGHDWTGQRPFTVPIPDFIAPTALPEATWSHPPKPLPRPPKLEALDQALVSLDLEPVPRVQLAWGGGVDPEPAYASSPSPPRALSPAASRPSSRPASAKLPSRPASAGPAPPPPSMPLEPLEEAAPEPPARAPSRPPSARRVSKEPSVAESEQALWEMCSEVSAGTPRVWLNFETPFADLPPLMLPPKPERDVTAGPEPQPSDFPPEDLEPLPHYDEPADMDLPEWHPPAQRFPQWIPPREPGPVGFMRGSAPVLIMDVSGTMNPKQRGRFKDVKAMAVELLRPDGELATAAAAFDVIAFCSGAWSWSATREARLQLLQSSQMYYSGRQVGARPESARLQNGMAAKAKSGACLQPTEPELLADACQWVNAWPEAVGTTSLLTAFLLAEEHWSADCWYVFSDGLAHDPEQCISFLEKRQRFGQPVPIIHTVGFFQAYSYDTAGERFLIRLSQLTGGTFQTYDPDLHRVYQEGTGFVPYNMKMESEAAAEEREWAEGQLRAERRKNMKLGITERLDVTMARVSAMHHAMRVAPAAAEHEAMIAALAVQHAAAVAAVQAYNTIGKAKLREEHDAGAAAVIARNDAREAEAREAYEAAHAAWEAKYSAAVHEWEEAVALLQAAHDEAQAAAFTAATGMQRPSSGRLSARSTSPASARLHSATAGSRPGSASAQQRREYLPSMHSTRAVSGQGALSSAPSASAPGTLHGSNSGRRGSARPSSASGDGVAYSRPTSAHTPAGIQRDPSMGRPSSPLHSLHTASSSLPPPPLSSRPSSARPMSASSKQRSGSLLRLNSSDPTELTVAPEPAMPVEVEAPSTPRGGAGSRSGSGRMDPGSTWMTGTGDGESSYDTVPTVDGSEAAAAIEAAQREEQRQWIAASVGPPVTAASLSAVASQHQRPGSRRNNRLRTGSAAGSPRSDPSMVASGPLVLQIDAPALLLDADAAKIFAAADDEAVKRVLYPEEVVAELDESNAARLDEIRSDWEALVADNDSANAKQLQAQSRNNALIDAFTAKIVDLYADSIINDVLHGSAVVSVANSTCLCMAREAHAAEVARITALNEKYAAGHAAEVAAKNYAEETYQQALARWEAEHADALRVWEGERAVARAAHAENVSRLLEEWMAHKRDIDELAARARATAEAAHAKRAADVKAINQGHRSAHAALVRARGEVEESNTQILAEAKAAHRMALEALGLENEAKVAAARVEHQALCVRLTEEHAGAEVQATKDFEDLRLYLKAANEGLTAEARKSFQEAMAAAQAAFERTCATLRAEHETRLEGIRVHNRSIWPQVQIARLATAELGRVAAFAEHLRHCANKYELGVNFRPNTPNYDRVVEMAALTEGLRRAFPDIALPGDYPWPESERKLQPGSGWTPSPKAPRVSYRDPAAELKELLASAHAKSREMSGSAGRPRSGTTRATSAVASSVGGLRSSGALSAREAYNGSGGGEGGDSRSRSNSVPPGGPATPWAAPSEAAVGGDAQSLAPRVGAVPPQRVSGGVRPATAGPTLTGGSGMSPNFRSRFGGVLNDMDEDGGSNGGNVDGSTSPYLYLPSSLSSPGHSAGRHRPVSAGLLHAASKAAGSTANADPAAAGSGELQPRVSYSPRRPSLRPQSAAAGHRGIATNVPAALRASLGSSNSLSGLASSNKSADSYSPHGTTAMSLWQRPRSASIAHSPTYIGGVHRTKSGTFMSASSDAVMSVDLSMLHESLGTLKWHHRDKYRRGSASSIAGGSSKRATTTGDAEEREVEEAVYARELTKMKYLEVQTA